MTLGGAYATRNDTIKHLQDLKDKAVLTEIMPFTTSEAAAAEEAVPAVRTKPSWCFSGRQQKGVSKRNKFVTIQANGTIIKANTVVASGEWSWIAESCC